MRIGVSLISLLVLITSNTAFAQPPSGDGMRDNRSVPGRPGGTNGTGSIYGKVQESEKKAALEFAVIQIFQPSDNPSDSTDGKLITGGISSANGDFRIEGVPLGQSLNLIISYVGYKRSEITFQLTGGEKDMGNIRLKPNTTLSEIVVDGSDPDYRIEFDKRVYDVEKNPINAGGTGEDVLRNIPALQVDMDGNVTMRNSSPQIFIDGRPTTLTIDQIPADAIQKVEVITNPSAKYDASGGGGGIINIVMKKNRTIGYNGSIRAGVDTRPRYNFGGDISAREGKFNFFLNGNYNQRKSLSIGTTKRTSYLNEPNTYLFQDQESTNYGFFLNGRTGVDYFMDNRNTFTVSQSFTSGQFNPQDKIYSRTDSIVGGDVSVGFSEYNRNSNTDRTFRNSGTSLLYKHLFPKEGTELTADLNYNTVSGSYVGNYTNVYSDAIESTQRQEGSSSQRVYTAQTDFSSVLNSKSKIELGVRGSMRTYESGFHNYQYDPLENTYHEITSLMVNYSYVDQVYAAYGTYSRNLGDWSYQVGLRAESSDYRGKIADTTLTFNIKYPLSLFPSLFLTKKLNEKQDIQLSVSRKINRPSFMQLIPFLDYSDSLNITSGNPELRPEFTNLAELSYQYNLNKENTFMASLFGRYMTDLTVRNQITQYSPVLDENIIINTYDNAGSSSAIGIELVSRNKFTKWFELTTNLNIYHSEIDGSNISANLTNSQNSWWVKTNAMFKLPKSFTFQAMFDYSGRKALSAGGSGGGGRGGGGMGGFGGGGFGGTENTVQGYVNPTYGLDLALRKEFSKPKGLSMSVNVQDVLKTRVNYTHSSTDLFVQDTFRRRDWQLVRFQLNWKFGKIDQSLFKRKNTNQNSEGMDG